MADRLAERGFSAAVAKRVLDRLTEVGLIDDAAFAQQWVRSRHTYSGKGKKVLAEELRRKGIAPEHADPALESVTAEDETARAVELVRRKLPALSADLDRDKAVRRLVSMLARRGYNPGTAYAVVTAELPASQRHAAAETPASSGNPDPAGASDPADGSNPSTSRRESPSADADAAAELVRAKLRTLSPALDRETAVRRLVGMLARRGYNSATAYQVVTAELASHSFERGPVESVDESPEPGADDDEQTRAAELVRAKLRTLPQGLARDKAVSRLVGLLARRGFSQSIAYSVVKSELAAHGFGA